jgi:hypothetical protein
MVVSPTLFGCLASEFRHKHICSGLHSGLSSVASSSPLKLDIAIDDAVARSHGVNYSFTRNETNSIRDCKAMPESVGWISGDSCWL